MSGFWPPSSRGNRRPITIKDVVNNSTTQAEGNARRSSTYSRINVACDVNKLEEELCCAICFDILFEPTTISCGHSFCKTCLSRAIDRCGKQCPNCRKPTSQRDSRAVNTVLWNTIRLLFPEQVKARQEVEALKSTLSKRH